MTFKRKQVTKETALLKLASLCGRSEQCEFDLNRKMVNWGISSSQRQEIITYLKENRFIDENRFARGYANDKARFSSWGPKKIRFELIKRKVSNTVISEALKNIDIKIWKEGILRCAFTKAKNLVLTGEEGFKDRQKLYSYLLNRGFPSQISSKTVMMMKKKQEENDQAVY